MAVLIFNTVLRLDGSGLGGFYRIVATPLGRSSLWLAFVGTCSDHGQERQVPQILAQVPGGVVQVARATLAELEKCNALSEVEFDAPGRMAREADLDEKDRTLWKDRQTIMAPFLNHKALCDSAETTGGIGPLVRTAME